jgi:hypothetical protein
MHTEDDERMNSKAKASSDATTVSNLDKSDKKSNFECLVNGSTCLNNKKDSCNHPQDMA